MDFDSATMVMRFNGAQRRIKPPALAEAELELEADTKPSHSPHARGRQATKLATLTFKIIANYALFIL